ncbi:MAG: hypothetical protein NTV49_05950 [Kiritimatiellaeota bacterium]|nr:hypothetical protein [Kiritimatiellota bacterium]
MLTHEQALHTALLQGREPIEKLPVTDVQLLGNLVGGELAAGG